MPRRGGGNYNNSSDYYNNSSDYYNSEDVYTDGACRDNGRNGARGGYGVYFGEGDDRNESGSLSGRQTNQRAELAAIDRALDLSDRDSRLNIHTDSEYSIKCMTEWKDNWQSNGWRTSSGSDVKNRDLIQSIDHKINTREAPVEFHHVRGHSGNSGNCQADRLANMGADRR